MIFNKKYDIINYRKMKAYNIMKNNYKIKFWINAFIGVIINSILIFITIITTNYILYNILGILIIILYIMTIFHGIYYEFCYNLENERKK